MHTALMEASMDGHVEVARLLLDSGAQVNMPADSFESPLTLAACGGKTFTFFCSESNSRKLIDSLRILENFNKFFNHPF
jgi:hypothetical protein